MTTYDETPYPSYNYPQTSPERLAAIASLFSLETPKIENCKVLEIGCASGGNLLPLAAKFPNATFTGIDLSTKQVDLAANRATAMQLKNVELIASSITEYDFADKKFDYILVHGVYSWVPSDVQVRILEVCQHHLSESGIAYVSYNTLPGWNAVKTVRDMMLYHTKDFDDPNFKVKEARNILQFVSENMQFRAGAYKELMTAEIKTLQKADDNYLLHDHLESFNEPCYFHQFIEKAHSHKLDYLADVELPAMYLGNQKQHASDTLKAITDTVQLEQYLDFLNNRRFRSSLLVKQGKEPVRNLTPERIDGLNFVLTYALKDPIDESSLPGLNEVCLVDPSNREQTATVSGRTASLAVVELVKALPIRLNLEQLTARVSSYTEKVDKSELKTEVAQNLLNFLLKGIVNISTQHVNVSDQVSNRPCISVATREFAKTNNLVPNLYHDVVTVADDQRKILPLVDGSRTISELKSSVELLVRSNEISLSFNGQPISNEHPDLKVFVEQYLDGLLHHFRINALLES